MLALLARVTRLDNRHTRLGPPHFKRRHGSLAACAAVGLLGSAIPDVGEAAVQVLVANGTEIRVQQNQLINVRLSPLDTFDQEGNELGASTLATSNRPPLRVTATYNGQALEVQDDLCVAMPPNLGGTALFTFTDDSGGAPVTLTVDLEQGGSGIEAPEDTCRDPAAPVEVQPNQPFSTEVVEDTQNGILLAADDLLRNIRDPNDDPNDDEDGQVFLTGAPSLLEQGVGTVAPETGGIRYIPASNFTRATPVTIRYQVTDSDGDGPATFEALVTVTPMPDPPVPEDSECPVGAGGALCLLKITDVDTPQEELNIIITQQPQFGSLGQVNPATLQVMYTPRPGAPDTDTFTYRVEDDSNGPFLTATVTVRISDVPRDPTAVIQLTRIDGSPLNPADIADTDGAAGEPVRLNGSSSLPGNPISPIVAYEWRVNGQLLTEQTAIVDTTLPDGQGTIELVVRDEQERASAPATLETVVGQRPNPPSSARIFVDGLEITGTFSVPNRDFEPGETVVFDGSQSTDPDEDPIVEYVWSLNGQEVQRGASPTATLALVDGANTITLTVTDERGGTGSITITANVAADPNLGTLSGLTPSQRSMGVAISDLCPRLNALGSLTAGQSELLDRCTDILSDDDPNAQRAALKALTPEEITSQQTTGIDFSASQLGNLTSRLVALRQGAGGGLSIAGLSIRDAKGNLIPVQELAALAKHLAGGASGDEDADGSLAARWGIFLNGNIIDGEKDETANESGYDFGGWGVTAGFDYRFTDNFVLGLSLGYNESETDFAGNGGSLDSEGVSTSIYGTYFSDRWYADFIGSSGSIDYESMRRIVYADADGLNDDTALGSTEGDLSTLGVSFGYDFNKGGWTFGPTLALTSVEIDIDAFAETGAGQNGGLNLAFGDQNAKSRTAQGGFQFSYAVSREWGVLSPQMRVAFVKEFENDSQVINVRFVNDPFANDPSQPSPGAITIVTDDPDEEYVRWGVGLTFVRANGVSAFIDYEALAGFRTVKSSELTFGVRFERSFK